MTVEEVYSKLASHMIEGIMIHDQLTTYYDFLQLKGYKRCHEYHYLCENVAYRGINRYYTNHHNKMIELGQIPNPELIPSSWYKYTRHDVDQNTKRNAVKAGLEKWVNWEKDTKELYEKMYVELMNLNEVASACKVKELISDVDQELKVAERKFLDAKAVDYDMTYILSEQKSEHKKYKIKIKKLGVSIC